MMDKLRWSNLKNGSVAPVNEEERHALDEYRKDQQLYHTFQRDEMFEPKTTMDRREGLFAVYRQE
jgi:hypothetical protein